MTTYEYKGVVEFKGETKTVGNNGFQKREIVVGNDVNSPNKYPNPVLFTFKKDRCALLDAIKVNDRVGISFTIDGRRWDGPNGTRYFTDLTGWKVTVYNEDGSAVEPVPAAPAAAEPEAIPPAADPDDLPF